MSHLQGHALEELGKRVIDNMGLNCLYSLSQTPLRDLVPDGAYGQGEHLEFDYLIPHRDICLVGEITGRSSANTVSRKYNKFRNHYNIVSRLEPNERLWQLLGVTADGLRDFREIREFKGFFISTVMEKFDIALAETEHIACFYRSDWRVLCEYSECIGEYACRPFLEVFDITDEEGRHPLELSEDRHALMLTRNKRIVSGDIALADIYTFEASPYELFPFTRVFRRDTLPDLAPGRDEKYQRPLIPKKLQDIRQHLLGDPDFMFPNSILVVLSEQCQYRDRVLSIADRSDSISVIDGQHRLYSYADQTINERLEDNCRIMVTAIKFIDASVDEVTQYSAKAFIEINKNQTSIPSTHIDAIAYSILKETNARAIAAQIILQANMRRRNSLSGLFATNLTGLGKIRATTVLTALKTITRIDYIQRLCNAREGSSGSLKRRGYMNLFGVNDITDLVDPETMIRHGVSCISRYFNIVRRVFSHDWPQRGQDKGSSLEYAKVIAGFVKLLWEFISEGADWPRVEGELDNIRANVMEIVGMDEYISVLFNPDHPDIPGSQPSAVDDYRFLHANRNEQTSIQDVSVQWRGR